MPNPLHSDAVEADVTTKAYYSLPKSKLAKTIREHKEQKTTIKDLNDEIKTLRADLQNMVDQEGYGITVLPSVPNAVKLSGVDTATAGGEAQIAKQSQLTFDTRRPSQILAIQVCRHAIINALSVICFAVVCLLILTSFLLHC